MQTPYVVGICPTKGRPKLIPNVLKMWESQDYSNKHLVIWDDQPNFPTCRGDSWEITAWQNGWFQHISMKYHEMMQYVLAVHRPDIVAVFEDDDVYLSRHISLGVQSILQHGAIACRNRTVWTNHPGGFGKARLFKANAPYHGSWLFTAEGYRSCGGYSNTPEKAFDVGFCRRLDGSGQVSDLGSQYPTYVYRFGTTGYTNASALGENFQPGYNAAHADTSRYSVPDPEYDTETQLLANLPSGNLPDALVRDPESLLDGLA